MTAKVQTVKVPVELVSSKADDDNAEAFADAPLFEVGEANKIANVLVQRTDPDEGTLGKMPPGVTELEIKRRWGGGTFQLQARDERNRPMKGGFRTVTIAGDPIFESKAAQMKWKRQQGIDDAPAAPAAESLGLKDLFAIIQSTGAQQRSDSDRRAAELEAQHKRELERIRVEGEIRKQERAEEEERRERRDQEREERRRREDAEREERRRKDDEAAKVRDREFQIQLAALGKKGNADGSEMLLKGIELARNLGSGGDEPDPVRTVAAALLPGVLERFGGGAKPAPPTAPAAAAVSNDAVTLDGPIATKARKVIEHLEGEGFDPESAIASAFDMLLKAKRKTAPDAAPAPALPAPSSAAAAAPAASNGTSVVKRRTTKK